IKDQQIVGLRRQCSIGIDPAGNVIYGITTTPQRAGEAVGNDMVVFGKQDAHRTPLLGQFRIFTDCGKTVESRSTQGHQKKNPACAGFFRYRSEEHTSELQSRENLVCRLLLEKKK